MGEGMGREGGGLGSCWRSWRGGVWELGGWGREVVERRGIGLVGGRGKEEVW